MNGLFPKVYLASAIGLNLLYVLSAAIGWEPGTPESQVIPASARESPGGYRSFHFWHSGYQGGK